MARRNVARSSACGRVKLIALVLVLVTASGQPQSKESVPVTPAAAEAFNAARRMQQIGDLHGAEREFMNAIHHTPDFPHALTALADLRMDAGRIDEAEKMYVQIVSNHPDWIPASNSLGFLYLEAGQTEKAIQQLTRVAVLSPTASALLNLGAAQKQAGWLDDAIASYKRARKAGRLSSERSAMRYRGAAQGG